MANQKQIEILKQGVDAWNKWRDINISEVIDLSGFDFTYLEKQYSYDTNDNQYESQLWYINLSNANLARTKFTNLYLQEINLCNSNLENSILNDCVFKFCNLRYANLKKANLKGARIIGTDLSYADLSEAHVFGISPWNPILENTIQNNLVITPPNQATITIDNIEVAQFIYTLLNNKKLQKTINTINQKVVLILGRFIPERKIILDAIREKLREKNYIPIVFDFDKPKRTTDETIGLLARMSKFVIADLTDAKSVLQELRGIVPELPSVPVCPIIQESQFEPGMFDFFKRYPWVLDSSKYKSKSLLIENIDTLILFPVEKYLDAHK